jgi:hypothetical protein
MIACLLRSLSLLLPLSALGCLSSAPPVAPVRWFDPLPPAPVERAAAAFGSIHVTAPPHLGREFVVRTGPRELAFDAGHQWIAEPRVLVATALAQAGGGAVDGARGDRDLVVELEAFEFELLELPVARVRLVVLGAAGAGARVAEATAVAAGSAPAQLAAAMAQALGEVVARVARPPAPLPVR